MKKLLSVLLAAAMLLFCVPPEALPVRAERYGLYTYTVSNGEVTIIEADPSIGGTKRLPTEIAGCPVTAIGDRAFYDCYYLTRVIIPDSITRVGASAFARCTNLVEVTMRDGVTTLGESAFRYCSALETVTLSNNLTLIESRAFMECEKLTNITIPDSVTRIGAYAFCGCSLSTITIGRGLRTVDAYAFVLVNGGTRYDPLTDVYYAGDEANWADITIQDSNHRLTEAENFHFGEHFHRWTEATCLAVKTCSLCGQAEGELAPHVWRDATCTKPKICKVCNVSSGEPLGHTWQGPTCTQQKKCAVCRLVSADPLGHGWYSPTCTAPGGCYFCQATRGEPLGHDYVDGVCTRCGEGTTIPEAPETELAVGYAVGGSGETVTLTFRMENAPAVKSLALTDFSYDGDVLEILSGEWTVPGGILSDWDENTHTAAIAFGENTDLNGAVFALTLRIREGAERVLCPVTCLAVARTVSDGTEIDLPVTVTAGLVTVGVRGDQDGTGILDVEDAVYLLYHTLLPDRYPLTQSGDMDRDGTVDSDDAIYLLYYCLLPDQYPL